MDKKIILAISLSLLVMLSWSALMTKFYPVENKVVTEEKIGKNNLASAPIKPASSEPVQPSEPLKTFVFKQDKMDVLFLEDQAAIQEVAYKDYQSYKFSLKYAFLFGDKSLHFEKKLVTANSIEFEHKGKDKQIIKRFIFSNMPYSIELEIETRNISSNSINLGLPLYLGMLDFSAGQSQVRYEDVTIGLNDKTLHNPGKKDAVFEQVKFLGLRDRYFCALVEPISLEAGGFIKKLAAKGTDLGLTFKEVELSPGQVMTNKFRIYLGPQELRLLSSVNPDWTAIINYGTFDFIGQLLLQALGLLYSLVHNWGWVIIILSIGIYFLLYPLTIKQMRSMKQMQALQPALEELRKTYKDNPQRMNKEVMELYKKHKVNPLSGCLPMILQIPIFFALYQVLIRSVALKGAKFLWIKDLSEPDALFTLPTVLPILGDKINLLPILMTIGMFIQQKSTMKYSAGGNAEQQKIMLIIFPLMFGFIFYNMPSGLVLYWFINSLLTLAYQFNANRVR
jgi:YidC/Oxa1 family membrane protein insertase